MKKEPKSLVVASSLRDLVYMDLIALGRTEAVAKEWGSIAAEFQQICGYKNEYTRPDITLFLGHLRKRGLLQSTINKYMKALRVLARVQDWDFPILAMKRVNRDEIQRPRLGKDQVISLILNGKRLLKPTQLSFLALSTVYGLRRIEMSRFQPSDLTDTLTVHTAKGGAKTVHLVPPEVKHYLEHCQSYKEDTLTHMFHQIMIATGLKASGGFGWHSIRRSLVTELIILDASALNVIRFMRWSEGSVAKEFGMLAMYAEKDQESVDREIFKLHPFLPYWRD